MSAAVVAAAVASVEATRNYLEPGSYHDEDHPERRGVDPEEFPWPYKPEPVNRWGRDLRGE